MIDGIRITKPPEMDKYSEMDILAELDLLSELSESAIRTSDGSGGRTEYESPKFHVKIMKTNDTRILNTLLEVTTLLEEASPQLVKTWMLGDDKILLAYPTYYYKTDSGKEKNIITRLIEELLRFAGWCLKNFPHHEAVSHVKEYIELYIRW